MSDPRSDVNDIEDIAFSSRDDSKYNNRVLPRSLRKRGNKEELACESFIPGTHSVYVKTWGCTHNTSDGEYMAGLLAAKGYTILDSPLDANVWLLNSCTVKGPSEDGFHEAVKRGQSLGKVIVAAGCVPQGQKDLPNIQKVSVVGVQQIDRVVEVVEAALQGNRVTLFGQRREGRRRLAGPSLDLPKIRRNPLIEIIPINSGCLNHCTYCKTKHSRGDLASYFPEDIVSRAKQAFSEGVVEVWLTSEDTGAYGRDIDVTLPELLWKLIKVVPEGCMLRIGMTNPPYIMEHLEEMAEILNDPHVYSFLHVPVQSAADPVLAAMKRDYTVAQFKELVDYLREHVPGITIVTDIICGFPCELEEDFLQTLELVEKYKFPSLFINQFYPRPGTPAAKMKRLPNNVVKNRSRQLTKLFRSYETYNHLIGSSVTILITEVSHDNQYYVGHTKCYEQVLVPPIPELMGRVVNVRIESAGKHHLMGVVLDSKVVKTSKPADSKSNQRTKLVKKNLSTDYMPQCRWAWSSKLRTVDVLLIVLLVFILIVISVYKLDLHWSTIIARMLFFV